MPELEARRWSSRWRGWGWLPVGEEQAEAEAPDAEQEGPPPGDASIPSSASSPAHGCRRVLRLLACCPSQSVPAAPPPPPPRPQLLPSRIEIEPMELELDVEVLADSLACHSLPRLQPTSPSPVSMWVGVGGCDARQGRAEQPTVGRSVSLASESTGARHLAPARSIKLRKKIHF